MWEQPACIDPLTDRQLVTATGMTADEVSYVRAVAAVTQLWLTSSVHVVTLFVTPAFHVVLSCCISHMCLNAQL